MPAPTLHASRKTKKTPIGEIPVDWELRSVGELFHVQLGKMLSKQSKKGANPQPYLGNTNVQWDRVDVGNVSTMDFTEAEGRKFALKPGDLLVCEGGEVGRTAIWRGELGHCYYQKAIHRLRAKDDRILPEFMLLYMRQIVGKKALIHLTSQSSIAHLTLEKFVRLPVCVPPVAEQHGIAASLSKWDRAIERSERLLKAKNKFKRALMQQLLTGRQRFKQFSTGKWETHRLNDLLERVFRPVTLSDDAPLDLISIRRRAGGLFFRGSFTAREFKTLDLNRIEAGDFLVSKRQVTHGAMAMVRKAFEGMHVSNEYVIFRQKSADKLHLPFFDWLSRSPRMWHMAYLASNGVHIEKLIFDADDFLREKITLPPSLSEQQKIVEVLEAADAELHMIERELATLHNQKRGLMQKLLTGKVRVRK